MMFLGMARYKKPARHERGVAAFQKLSERLFETGCERREWHNPERSVKTRENRVLKCSLGSEGENEMLIS